MPPRRSSSPAAKRAASSPAPAPAPPANLALAILTTMAKNFLTPTLMCLAESLVLPKYAPSLVAAGPVLGLPRAFGLVVLINVIGTAFLTILIGFKVGAARSKYTEKATKDGDDDAEARFAYPKMYAEGFSTAAREFNCVQRSHQHTLETYQLVLVMSLIGGLSQPLTTAGSGLLWMVARHKWANGYAAPGGDPKNRYDKSDGWGRHIWTSLLALAVTCVATAGRCLLA